jgi:DNA-binding transcriptional ArsR family regulator
MAYAYRILDALGDPTRRLVFMRLRSGTRSVREIADRMDVSRPAVSQHLKILKAAHLVTDRASGTRRLYAVDQRGIKSLRSWLDGFWEEALFAFKEAAEQEAAKGIKTMKRSKRRNHEVRADDVPQ